jgi:integrase
LIGASRTKPGTVNAAIVGYYTSLAFRELAPGTQAMRRAILERFREEHGDKSIRTLPQEFIAHILSRKKPVAARNWLKALRGLLDFAAAEGFRTGNPTHGIKLPRHKNHSHHPWTPEEMAQYEAHHPIGSKARLAFALLRYTGQRRGDVIRMGPRDIRGGAIHVRQGKTGAEVNLTIDPDLQAVLDATPCRHLVFITTKTDKPFSPNDFSEWFRAQCDAAGLPKECSAHGLRHAMGYGMANDGATTHQIAAVLGHKSLSEVQRYTKAADQTRMARDGMALRIKRRTGIG